MKTRLVFTVVGFGPTLLANTGETQSRKNPKRYETEVAITTVLANGRCSHAKKAKNKVFFIFYFDSRPLEKALNVVQYWNHYKSFLFLKLSFFGEV